jgi:hypothetical protein
LEVMTITESIDLWLRHRAPRPRRRCSHNRHLNLSRRGRQLHYSLVAQNSKS